MAKKIDDIIKTGTTSEYEKIKKNPQITAYETFNKIHNIGSNYSLVER